jgi:hypothetical protein
LICPYATCGQAFTLEHNVIFEGRMDFVCQEGDESVFEGTYWMDGGGVCGLRCPHCRNRINFRDVGLDYEWMNDPMTVVVFKKET